MSVFHLSVYILNLIVSVIDIFCRSVFRLQPCQTRFLLLCLTISCNGKDAERCRRHYKENTGKNRHVTVIHFLCILLFLFLIDKAYRRNRRAKTRYIETGASLAVRTAQIHIFKTAHYGSLDTKLVGKELGKSADIAAKSHNSDAFNRIIHIFGIVQIHDTSHIAHKRRQGFRQPPLRFCNPLALIHLIIGFDDSGLRT